MKATITTLLFCLLVACQPAATWAELRAGAAVVDVTPREFPVLVNGGMLSRSVSEVKTRVNARAIVLDDGKERLAIVVVDSCMMGRPLLDEAKQLASTRTKIQPDHILISATHTHSAPASMGCLGTDADPKYVPFLREKLAQAILEAESHLEPAKVGWGVGDAGELTALRRWIRRPDRMAEDPFGNLTVRANMHAGTNWDDVTGVSGPEDPDLSLISLKANDGRPIAVLANFSMHYFGDKALSADYFGLFCEGLESRLQSKQQDDHPPFVAIMSHGCSGDVWRRDYSKPVAARADNITIESYTEKLIQIAREVYDRAEYNDAADLAMSEALLELKYRAPDKQRLEWAQKIVENMGDRAPKDRTEVYAREQIMLHERQSAEIIVQAVRIGDIGIATTPNETYALTGLKLKLQSPLPKTMVIELANGGDGYIPPPEQHFLGGYNTWAARSAGLEIEAEPKIVEAGIVLLEQVSNRPRRVFQQSQGRASQAIIDSKPTAYWRMDNFAGPIAADSSDNHRDAVYEDGVAFFLVGPRSDVHCTESEQNRAVHFAGGRLRARIDNLAQDYSVSFWFWNGMPLDARETAGWMFSRGRDNGLGALGDHLGLGGTANTGKLVFLNGAENAANPLVGRTELQRWTWNQVVIVRRGNLVRVYLNRDTKPEIEAKLPSNLPPNLGQLFFGGRCDNQSNWEGRLDEIAVYDRALTPTEVAKIAIE